MKLANLGAQQAIAQDPGIAEGVNTYDGHLTYKAVADNQSREYTPVDTIRT
jgi:alanine dehydrogenase